MFTGIITHLGTVRRVAKSPGSTRFEIASDIGALGIGASIACAGVCLTVVEKEPGWFGAEVSLETLARTNLVHWRLATKINLERPLKVGDELGGHFVLGHVDGIAEVRARRQEGDSVRLTLAAPNGVRHLVAPKGSVTLDGVALTINEVDGATFGVNIIPHTLAVTTLGAVTVGTRLNFEPDPLARYVARLIEVRGNN
ncbi:MAG: riboflavin synthase [Alphaproteobacteria bacterium]|nr:riboflavin synthase [Alphaproteobacteria bacterium]